MVSRDSEPLISIITPCLNRVNFVAEAVESVMQQDYPQVEHIIMDGGSTDGTLEVLKRYPHLRVISQKDDGLYDAINKGVKLAKGEVIGFLNTDDLFEPNCFGIIVQLFLANPELEAVCGGADLFQDNEEGQRERLVIYPPIQREDILLRATEGESSFNAWFFRRNLLIEFGVLDTHYRCAADREFLIRFGLQKRNFHSLNQVVYHYRRHKGSLTLGGGNQGEAAFTFEQRSLAECYLEAKPSLCPEERQIFQTWHSMLTTDQVIGALKKAGPGRALGYARRGLHYNRMWLIYFTQRTAWRAGQSIRWKTRRFRRPLHGA